jgi:hypothetical protein
MVDFIVEWTDMNTPVSDNSPEHWKMYFDGSLDSYTLMAPHGPRQTRWPNTPKRAARVSELLANHAEQAETT